MMPEDVAALTTQFRVRVLNCSAAGCLLETNWPLAVGTVGKLRVLFDGKEFDDPIQVVRCALIQGTGVVHHVGARFLSMTPPYAGTLRYMMRRDAGALSGVFDAPRIVP